MLRLFRQLTLCLMSKSGAGRRTEARLRIEPLPGRLSDLYRERIPVQILNVSRSGIGVKVEECFAIDFPVLIECDDLLIVGNVRHCIKAAKGGYVLGMKIHKIVDLAFQASEAEVVRSAACTC
jgi:hypothetical protein